MIDVILLQHMWGVDAMKKWIKANIGNEIIDVFFDYQKSKFDGNEIFIEDTEIKKHKLNGKSISEENGIWLFKWIDNNVIEKTLSEINAELKDPVFLDDYLQNKLDKLTDYINKNWPRAAKRTDKIQEKFKENKDLVFSSIYEIDNAIEEIKLDMFTPEA